MQNNRKWIWFSSWIGITTVLGGSLMDWIFDFVPKLTVVIGFIVSVAMIIHGFYPILPWQWVGWGKRNRWQRLNVKDWQGRPYYRLCDAAALWVDIPPDRPDDPYGFASHRLWFLISDIRSGDLQCDEPDDVKHEIGNLKTLLGTPISSDALRAYASKQGETPEFLK